MVFKKTNTIKPAVDYIYGVIAEKLKAGQKVAWVITGGSGMAVDLAVAKKLESSKLENLTVFLSDERFGPVGHTNSNWAFLEENDFNLGGAKLIPALVDRSLDETVQLYQKAIKPILEDAKIYKLAMTGIGADGHALGIKPKSPAVFSEQLVSGYRGEDFTRVTLTPKAVALMDEFVCYVAGEEKHKILDELDKDLSVVTQPAQALKQVDKLTIYNDYKGEPA